MPVYNKLIRDKIPQIMDAESKQYSLRTLTAKDYVIELKKKLEEELNEYLTAEDDRNALEELADLLELIHTLTTVHGSNPEKLEQLREKKADKRGGFDERLFLVEVYDEQD